MLPAFSPPGSADLESLDAYLMSERAPPDCMDISQLDGFLAGVAVGPEQILPSEFLPVVWGGDEPEFADEAEAQTVLGAILARYSEIAAGLEAVPASYGALFWQDRSGTRITEDWAVGFMQAVALRSDAWEPVLYDDDSAIFLLPIGIIAGVAEPDLAVQGGQLPETFLDELMEMAPEVLPGCVMGLRSYFAHRAAAGTVSPPGRDRRH